ncbi:MAG: T9SS type A sorting domain-containing protein [Bacteroidetes bacterium]|nr:T9SS type A sorting domain-containing protein [Bacteroidota bacterium]
MKHVYLSLLLIAPSFGILQAQNSITLDIDHQLGSSEFAFFSETAQSNYMFELTRLQYYISDIAITHDGGTLTDIEDVWILVNANGTGQFELGDYAIDNVEAISFYVGVGPDVNHEDPASWPSDHALYPQNPSMHWGWASGYRFVCMEGNAGPSSPDNLFQIHALGDNNYFQTVVEIVASADAGSITIPLVAEYANSLNGIDVSSGVINHATNGESIPLLQNFSTEVFSAGVVSSVEEDEFEGELVVSPNPSEGAARLNLNIPPGEDYSLRIIDMHGRLVEVFGLNVTNGTIELPQLSSGLYLIELQQAGAPLTAIRWSVK